MDLNSTPKEEDENESSFMERLKSAPWKSYCFQKDMIRPRSPYLPRHVYGFHPDIFDAYQNQSFPIVRARDLDGGVKHYSFDELMKMTDCLNSTTFLCYTVLGTLHRGTIHHESGRRDVLVKTWEFFLPFVWQSYHQPTRIHDELNLLRVSEIRSHPNVVNLIGFHCERRLAVVYDYVGGGEPRQLLHHIIPCDNFTWGDRMKVANEMASVLETFHNKGLVHSGVHSKTILLTEDKSAVVYDFGQFSYFKHRETYEEIVKNLYVYDRKYLDGPPWSMRCDIFAFGILLLELINKQQYPDLPLEIWDESIILNYDLKNSAVDYSFNINEKVALRITTLAIDCLKVKLDEQPTIGDIVRELKDLMLHFPPNKLQKISY
ncbi:serine/threonine-protein kinase-like protein At5g23170 [Henckelia pumila]|uniref:serine/threonine-protein kinase-like protein At5g23170 n=1 Tax=Henckelia pumila TaxID=405737 RepID=UPI003C6DDC01